jgi:uncharacterized RDD family membrane protein YckC
MPETFKWETNANPQAPPMRGGKVPSGRTWGGQDEPSPGEYVVRYAGLGYRILAGLIDYIISLLVTAEIPKIGPIVYLGWLAYNSVWLQGTSGQSWGKRITGLKLCYIKGDTQRDAFDYYELPGVQRCAWRLVAHSLDWMLLYGFLVRPLFNARKRTFADSIARTVVIRDDRVHIFTREEAEADRNRGMIA